VTALNIYRTAKPSSFGGPVLPMCPEDEAFWRLRRERVQQKGNNDVASN